MVIFSSVLSGCKGGWGEGFSSSYDLLLTEGHPGSGRDFIGLVGMMLHSFWEGASCCYLFIKFYVGG